MRTRPPSRLPRALYIAALIVFMCAPGVAGAQPPPPAQPQAPIAPAVAEEMSASGQATYWVVLKAQADVSAAYRINDWNARGQYVYDRLRTTAETTQSELVALLNKRHAEFTSYWIVNALRVTSDQATLDEVSRQPGVKEITASKTYEIPKPIPGTEKARIQAVEWNINRIRADEVWSTFGIHGEGIVVANIDTGVDYTHPALNAQYRGNLGGGSYDNNYNWYDPTGICPPGAPCDNVFHGTHTMGTMVGDDGVVNQIGVAPGARWIAAKGCEYDWCSDYALLSAGQWILAPTDLAGANPRPDLRPHIVNNSWGGGPGQAWYQGVVQAWVAAGIFPAFSIGNAGSSCGSAGSPGDYPESYAAGAFDIGNSIAWFSSRGPSAFGGITKPDIAAPGVDVRSSVPGGYGWNSGTSMASPHVAGTVALIWSAAPALVGDIAQTRTLLNQSAIDTDDTSCGGDAGNNNVWGEGRLDAFEAVNQSPHGPTGALQGTVTDSATGLPLAGVLIQAAGPLNRTTVTDGGGFYSFPVIVAGSYDVTASIFGSLSQTVTGVVVAEGVPTIQDFALVPAPSHAVSGVVRDDLGVPLASATVTILDTPIPPVSSGPDGAYTFPSVPEGSYQAQAEAGRCNDPQTLPLEVNGDETLDFALPGRMDAFGYRCRIEPIDWLEAANDTGMYGDDQATEIALPPDFDFPFYGQAYSTRAWVSTNGHMNFLGWNPSLGGGPIPQPWEPNAAVYAFWDDLFVPQIDGTSVRTDLLGEAPNRRFVIEWRNVGFCCSDPPPGVSFEAVLYENGEILMQYTGIDGDWREQGGSATLGIENETGTIAFQYSADEPVITNGLAIRYIPPPLGRLEGTVIGSDTNAPIAGASIHIEGALVRDAVTDADGRYQVLLMTGAYDVTAGAYGYISQTATGVAVSEDATTVQDFLLESLPKHTFSGQVTDDLGPLAGAKVSVLGTPLPPVFTDAGGNYTFPGVPEGTFQIEASYGKCDDPQQQELVLTEDKSGVDFTLTVRRDSFGYYCRIVPIDWVDAAVDTGMYGDDTATEIALPFAFPLYDHIYSERAWVSTNGHMNFLGWNASLGGGQIPQPWEPNAAIYAFWDDLYVPYGEHTSVRTELLGDAPNRRFVIEWRNVGFCCSYPPPGVSFEVVLYENGEIRMQYTGIDSDWRERGGNATLGIENEAGSIAFQYSAGEPVITDNLAVQYVRPPSGFVRGTVTDAIDGLPIPGATVTLLETGRSALTDAAGAYGLWAPVGEYTVEARAENYATGTALVTILDGQVATQDFALDSARAQVAPESLFLLMPADQTRTRTLTLSNAGSADLTFEILERPVPEVMEQDAPPMPAGVDSRTKPAGYTPTSAKSVSEGGSVLVFMDSYPWGSGALFQVLSANGIPYDIAGSGGMYSMDMSPYEVVFIASDQPQGFYDNYNANAARFAEYVANGGFLWVGAAAWGWNGGSFDGGQLPGGATVRGPVWESYNDVLDAGHPLMAGLPNPFWGSYASHAAFENLPAGTNVIARGQGSGMPTLIEYEYGFGRVLAFGQTLEIGFSNGWDVGRILENGVPYAYGFEPQIDIPWISENPTVGTVSPGASQPIQVIVDTTGLAPGIYRAQLVIRVNDPKTPKLIVPVTLVVSAYMVGVNAGNGAYVDLLGDPWAADRLYSVGNFGYVSKSARAASTKKPIAGTDDDKLYQSYRQSPVEYKFDLPVEGVYQVELRFAELESRKPGTRLFDVIFELNNVVLPAHDIAYEVGTFKADNHTFFVQISDGQLNIRFVPRRGYAAPIVNAIRVTQRPDY